ncbi:hypothetical protein LPJ53_003847 [Coemansia erecta]|uniref:RNA polymerase II subunit B1 CTD phosphatase RPAP2 homolog n=1 Tax=Coemansia erecta TaxID=147472 RepID=A0A9W7Y0C0_9FUNG|nr:hypothetical protein LPJ53_003847 [Coemansia erecta]
MATPQLNKEAGLTRLAHGLPKQKQQLKNKIEKSADTGLSKEAQQRRRSVVKESVRTRAQYEGLSLRWQEKLSDPVSEDLLVQAARYITPDDYDSIIEERLAGNLCAYPLCDRKPRKDLQRFHISLAKRKVFDQEELQQYCCNQCMVGSRFYKQQLSDETLYMRGRNFKIDIIVMPLSYGEEQKPGEALAKAIGGANGDNESLQTWYRKSLMDKMMIPKVVADKNPLQIVEHEAGSASFDIVEGLGKMQFADIEGFEPEADSARIKRDVVRINKREASARRTTAPFEKRAVSQAAKNNSAASGSDGGVLKITVEGKDIDPQRVLEPSFVSSDDEGHGDDDDDDDNDEGTYSSDSDSARGGSSTAPSKRDKYDLFSKMFGSASSGGRSGPSLSLFGRLWTLVDKISTEQTQRYLKDLKMSQTDGLVSIGNTAEYSCSPGDQSMATRQAILFDGLSSELDAIRGRLQIKTTLKHEARVLISTLELGSNMSVLKKHEYQALCIVFIFALSQSLDSLGQHLSPEADNDSSRKALLELDRIADDLGIDTSSLRMISRRLCEPY